MPLIFAYHFRLGHLRFSIKQHLVEQQGIEQVEFDGKTRTARVLLVRNKSTGKAHCRLHVFENGEYYSIDLLETKVACPQPSSKRFSISSSMKTATRQNLGPQMTRVTLAMPQGDW